MFQIIIFHHQVYFTGFVHNFSVPAFPKVMELIITFIPFAPQGNANN